MRYLEENEETAVAADLKTNFRFTREFLPLARALYQLVTSDFERGLLYREITGMQNVLESMMRNSIRTSVAKQVDALEIMLDRKLAANESLNETSVLERMPFKRSASADRRTIQRLLGLATERGVSFEDFCELTMRNATQLFQL